MLYIALIAFAIFTLIGIALSLALDLTHAQDALNYDADRIDVLLSVIDENADRIDALQRAFDAVVAEQDAYAAEYQAERDADARDHLDAVRAETAHIDELGESDADRLADLLDAQPRADRPQPVRVIDVMVEDDAPDYEDAMARDDWAASAARYRARKSGLTQAQLDRGLDADIPF